MGIAGVVAFGSANLALHILVLSPLLLGPLGAYLEARRFGSPRGSLVAGVLYAVLPVPYNALSQGHWAGLVAYAAAPWVLGKLAALAGQAPWPFLHWDAAWSRFLSLGLLVALTASLAPAVLLAVPFLGLALCAGSLLAGRGSGGARFVFAALLVSFIAFVALVPWSAGALRSWASVLGPVPSTANHLGVSEALRLQTGQFGGGLLGWALLVVAGLPIAVGRSWRLAWATRLWAVALCFMALAWAGSRGWFSVPELEVLMAPAGAALALSAAVGGACVEQDLPGYRFGWRQLAPALGGVAVVANLLPFASWAGGGQWGLPSSGAESAFAFPAASPGGDYRVLWVGTQGSLPMTSQGSEGGLVFATSLDGLPSADQLWVSSRPGEVPLVAADLRWADDGQTTALGHLLAPLAVRYVVVQSGRGSDEVLLALARQLDMVPVGTDPAYYVFANAVWVPMLSVQANGVATGTPIVAGSWEGAAKLQQLGLSRSAPLVTGTAGGTVQASLSLPRAGAEIYSASPPGSLAVTVDGRSVPETGALGFAAEWALPAGEDAVAVSPRGVLAQHVADAVLAVIWALAVLALVRGTRARLRNQIVKAAMGLRPPGADGSEIDWSSVWEEESVV
jgi:hypothetical protein